LSALALPSAKHFNLSNMCPPQPSSPAKERRRRMKRGGHTISVYFSSSFLPHLSASGSQTGGRPSLSSPSLLSLSLSSQSLLSLFLSLFSPFLFSLSPSLSLSLSLCCNVLLFSLQSTGI